MVNVHARGVGPICRLCVKGTQHGGAGRTHKHAVKTAGCAAKNLPTAEARPEFEGKTLVEVWRDFCAMGAINHDGSLRCADYDPTKVIL